MEFAAVLADFKGALVDLRPQDFAPGLLWGVWALVLLIGLKGIDLRDDITQLCYVGVVLALGVILGIALPRSSQSGELSAQKFVLILSLILAARVRWLLADNSAQVKLTKEKTAKK